MNLNWNFAVGGDLRERINKHVYNLVCFLK
jgi:hypothetical protein